MKEKEPLETKKSQVDPPGSTVAGESMTNGHSDHKTEDKSLPLQNGCCNHNDDSNTSTSNHKNLDGEASDSTIEVINKNQDSSDNKSKEDESKASSSDQEFIFIHDTGFTIKIAAPCLEPFEIQVCF